MIDSPSKWRTRISIVERPVRREGLGKDLTRLRGHHSNGNVVVPDNDSLLLVSISPSMSFVQMPSRIMHGMDVVKKREWRENETRTCKYIEKDSLSRKRKTNIVDSVAWYLSISVLIWWEKKEREASKRESMRNWAGDEKRKCEPDVIQASLSSGVAFQLHLTSTWKRRAQGVCFYEKNNEARLSSRHIDVYKDSSLID